MAPRTRRLLIAGVGLVALVAVVLVVSLRARAQGRAAPPAGQAERVVPVHIAPVERRDVPVWLEGLGNVAAWQTVTVRAQVDGVLKKVSFVEGQEVRPGDPLVEIDPRPYQVQLQQAEGALKRDLAQLRGNQL